MKKTLFCSVIFFIILWLPMTGWGETLVDYKGDVFHGEIIEKTAAKIKIKTQDEQKVIEYEMDKVYKVVEKDLYQTYLKKKQECKKETDEAKKSESYYQLGKWCKENKLFEEALQSWSSAARINKHVEAMEEMGFKNNKNEWVLEREKKEEDGSVINDNDANPPAGCYLRISIIPDADDNFLQDVKRAVESCSDYLWTATCGQMYIKKALVIDNDKKGHVLIESLTERLVRGEEKSGTVRGNKIILPGNPGGGLGSTMYHEFGHARFMLPDESQWPCAMNNKGIPALFFCNRCVDQIKKRYKKWEFPGLGTRSGWYALPPPWTYIVIRNQ
ncbi:MAG: hypothetical protein AAB019_05970 [Planctomycetota bacterium]